jgi:hypothetical protein
LEKEDKVSVLEKGIRPCNPGERRLELAVLKKGDRSLLSWRKGMGSQSWRKELDLAILEKGYGALQCWRKEKGPCGVGERRWALSLGER